MKESLGETFKQTILTQQPGLFNLSQKQEALAVNKSANSIESLNDLSQEEGGKKDMEFLGDLNPMENNINNLG